jgi:hypothetical protein
LSAAKSGANSDITSITGLTTALTVAQGGTGVTTSTGSGANVLGTSPTIASPTISGAVVSSMASSVITSGTAVASTSGTSIDFTSIPTWVKRVTILFGGVSTNGTSDKLIQLGNGSFVTTGYVGATGYVTTSTASTSTTTGFGLSSGGLAAETNSGFISFVNITGNTWVCSATISSNNGNQPGMIYTNGQISLASVLDRIRITTANGTDTFDAGSINILYE